MHPSGKKKERLIIPLVICGGSGTRLWPASRESRPKQFLALFGTQSTFQETIRRVADPVQFGPPVIVTSGKCRALVADQLDELNIEADIVLEPEGRDSGPAILAGTLFIAGRRGGNVPVLSLAADHMIRNVTAFQTACRTALSAAQSGHIVTFGVIPDHPATGYGYIEAGAEIMPGIHHVTRFVEKPNGVAAAHYVRQGYLWNSGNFLFQASAVTDAYGKTDPATLTVVQEAVDKARAEEGRAHHLDKAAFARAMKLSFDYAVMEKTPRAAVIPATFDWSDVGSWAAVHKLSDRDEAGNAAKGEVVFNRAKDNIVASDGPLVALVGVSDLAVIAAGDAVLVARRDDSSGIKVLVEQLKKSHAPVTQGSSLTDGLGPVVKRINLAPGGRLSPSNRREHARHWLVTEGTAQVTFDKEIRWLKRHESIHIPAEAKYILENSGTGPLHILEIELGIPHDHVC